MFPSSSNFYISVTQFLSFFPSYFKYCIFLVFLVKPCQILLKYIIYLLAGMCLCNFSFLKNTSQGMKFYVCRHLFPWRSIWSEITHAQLWMTMILWTGSSDYREKGEKKKKDNWAPEFIALFPGCKHHMTSCLLSSCPPSLSPQTVPSNHKPQ